MVAKAQTTNGNDRSGPGTGTRGERTRAAIVAAGRERFASLGYAGTKLADVAADAGVSEPTVAFHFGGKAGLLAAAIGDYYDELVAEIETALDVPGTPRERIGVFARFWLHAHERNHQLHGVFIGEGGWSTGDPDVVAALRENNRRVTRHFERLLEDLRAEGELKPEVSTRLTRDAFFGTAEHSFRGWLGAPDPPDLDQIADAVLEFVLPGAWPPAGGAVAGVGEPSLASIEQKLDRLLAR